MIISQKCNCCLHDKICSFKGEYVAACEAVKTATYGKGENGFIAMKDSTVDVHINCPNMMTASAMREYPPIQLK